MSRRLWPMPMAPFVPSRRESPRIRRSPCETAISMTVTPRWNASPIVSWRKSDSWSMVRSSPMSFWPSWDPWPARMPWRPFRPSVMPPRERISAILPISYSSATTRIVPTSKRQISDILLCDNLSVTCYLYCFNSVYQFVNKIFRSVNVLNNKLKNIFRF